MNGRTALFLVVVLTLTSGTTALGDIPVPGWRNIEHTFEVTGLERAPAGTVFVLAPLHLGQGHEVIEPGKRFTYRAKYANPNLYALNGDPHPEDLDPKGLEESGVPRAVGPFPVVSSVETVSLVARMHSVYEFTAIRDGRVELRHVSTTRYGAGGGEVSGELAGWPWPPLALSALALALLVGMGVRRRGRRRVDGSERE